MTGLLFLFGESAPEGRLHAEDLKDGGGGTGSADLLGLSAAGEIEGAVADDADAFEAGHLFAPLGVDSDVDGQRGIGLEQLGSPLGESHEAFGMGKIGGLEEDSVNEREDGGIGSDADGQREHDHEGEHPVAEEAADGVADFGSHR